MYDDQVLRLAVTLLKQLPAPGKPLAEQRFEATYDELVAFSNALFNLHVKDICQRVGIHTAASSRLAHLTSAVRQNAPTAALALIARKFAETPLSDE